MKLLTINETCALAAISRATIYRLIKAGALKPVKIGRSVRIPDDELDAFLENLKAARHELP